MMPHAGAETAAPVRGSPLESSGLLGGKKLWAQTLGCRLNQYETDSLVSRFHQAGCLDAASVEEADICLLNTCTVTAKADRKTRNTQSALARKLPRDSLLVLTGCHVELHRPRASDHPPTLLCGNQDKAGLFEAVEDWFASSLSRGGWVGSRGTVDSFAFPSSHLGNRTRGFLKIQDGCDRACTYCIVPRVRGSSRSRPLDQILQQARTLLSEGYRELVLTGVNVGQYRMASDPSTGLSDLVARLLEIPLDFRLRLASLEPQDLGGELLAHYQDPRFMPHLHLCIQSGSDRVLGAMGRAYSRAGLVELCDALGSQDPRFCLTGDLICGFPGETEEDFNASLDLCTRAGFARLHVFPYSPRPGTLAATMAGQCPAGQKKARARAAAQLSGRLWQQYRQSLVGSLQTVLVETVRTQGPQLVAEGLSPHYVRTRILLESGQAPPPSPEPPDPGGSLALGKRSRHPLCKQLCPVRIIGLDGVEDGGLLARMETKTL